MWRWVVHSGHHNLWILCALIFTVIRMTYRTMNKSLLADADDAWLFWHSHCGLEQDLGNHEVSPSDLEMVWICHADDVCSCMCVSTDVNECEDNSLCLGGKCTNNIGSYSCSCPAGLELVDGICRGTHTQTFTFKHTQSASSDTWNMSLVVNRFLWLTSCCHLDTAVCVFLRLCVTDINECLTMGICEEGNCLNTEGSYTCICPKGYTTIDGRPGCQGTVTNCRKSTNSNGKLFFAFYGLRVIGCGSVKIGESW